MQRQILSTAATLLSACAKARVPVSEAIISLENVDVVWYVTSPSNLSAPVMAAAEANEAEENTEAQSVIPEIETAPVTSS